MKLLFFIFTVIIVTVGEARFSTVVTILQEEPSYSSIQKSQFDNSPFENYNADSWLNNTSSPIVGYGIENYTNWLRSAAKLEQLTEDQIESLVRQNAVFEELVGATNADEIFRMLRSDPDLVHLVRDGSKVDIDVLLRGARGGLFRKCIH